jgi:hypothetical protein
MRTMYVPGSVIHVHSSYITWTSSHTAAFTGSRLGVAANPRLELVVVLELLEVSFHSFVFA